MKSILLILFTFFIVPAWAQPNCKAYLYMADTMKYEACQKALKSRYHYQFSKRFHEILDEAIAIDSTFDYAWREKSVAYLKSGDAVSWKKYIDKAVGLSPEMHLGYRGWCHYQFFRDYEGALEDFDKLEKIIGPDLGYSANGDYHLQIAKAICYMGINEHEKAVATIRKHMSGDYYSEGGFDYFQLGVALFYTQKLNQAIQAFEKQNTINPLAEAFYFQALCTKSSDPDSALTLAKIAKQHYQENKYLFDPYTHHGNKVYAAEMDSLIRDLRKK